MLVLCEFLLKMMQSEPPEVAPLNSDDESPDVATKVKQTRRKKYDFT